MRRVVVFFIFSLLSCNVYATLGDLNPPDWRTKPAGIPPTSLQGWSFSTNDNPAIADVVNNDFGDPTLDITIASPTGRYFQTYDAGGGAHQGVWMVTALDYIDIYIPNSGDNDPETWKEIWLQIIYSDPGGTGAQVPIDTNPDYASLNREPLQDLGDGYVLDTYSIIIEPNPPWEEVLTFAIQCQIYIDEIVVDTMCVPEPATIILLGLGGLLLRKRR